MFTSRMMNRLSLFFFLCLSWFLFSCTNGTTDQKEAVKVETKAEKPTAVERAVRNVSVQLIKNKIDFRESNYVLLDVRTKEEYDDGFIPTAQWADIKKEKEFVSKIEGLDKNATYYVYCHSGVRSKKAFDVMTDMGFTDVYNVRGGYVAWMEMMEKQ